MDTLDKVIKAAEKLEILSKSILEDEEALTPLAILWAGYTVAEAIRPSKEELTRELDELLERFHEVNAQAEEALDPSMKEEISQALGAQEEATAGTQKATRRLKKLLELSNVL